MDDFVKEGKLVLRSALTTYAKDAAGPLNLDKHPQARQWLNDHAQAIEMTANSPSITPDFF